VYLGRSLPTFESNIVHPSPRLKRMETAHSSATLVMMPNCMVMVGIVVTTVRTSDLESLFCFFHFHIVDIVQFNKLGCIVAVIFLEDYRNQETQGLDFILSIQLVVKWPTFYVHILFLSHCAWENTRYILCEDTYICSWKRSIVVSCEQNLQMLIYFKDAAMSKLKHFGRLFLMLHDVYE
jgi:hypothetical protein